jgi:Tfp pilus assembly protein PilF
MRQERFDEAGEQLRQALALDPEWGRGRHWLQLAQADRGSRQVREAAWDTARYREAEGVRAALVRARAGAAAQPGNASALVAWSRAALRADRAREARVAARAAVRADPANAAAYHALAAACQRLGRLEDRIVAMEGARAAGRGVEPRGTDPRSRSGG